MRLAITIGRLKGSKKFTVITGPDVPAQEQAADFKTLQGVKKSEYAEIQLWNGRQGMTKRHHMSEKSSVNQSAILPVREQQRRKRLKAEAARLKADAAKSKTEGSDKKPDSTSSPDQSQNQQPEQ